eukprot:jgi/Botrbrau1/16298/Bobra.0066s0067.1
MAASEEAAGVKATIRIGAPSKVPISQLPEVDEDIPYIHGHKGGLLKLLGGVRPTNNMILIQRPFNRTLHKKNSSKDDLASKFRDNAMPLRAVGYKLFPPMWTIYQFVVENMVGVHGMMNYVDARTQFFDEIVNSALDEGIRQVVVLAAGYDTRPYRLCRPFVKFFELDLPHVSENKKHLVNKILPDATKYPRPTYIGADLANVPLKEALTAGGFDPAQRTMFTCEGILCYLPRSARDNLMKQISEIAVSGSRLCFDFIHEDALMGRKEYVGYKAGAKCVADKGEPLLSGFDHTREGLAPIMERWGFELTHLYNPKDVTAKYHPHLKWSEKKPPHLSFCSEAAVRKI